MVRVRSADETITDMPEFFVHIRTDLFQPMPGEEEEVINEGMFGRALAEYLQQELRKLGMESGNAFHEDWGVYLEVRSKARLGLCLYAGPSGDGKLSEWVVSDTATHRRQFRWRKLQWIDIGDEIDALRAAVLAIFRQDPQIEVLSIGSTMPF